MKLFPKETLNIHSPFHIEETRRILQENIEPRKWRRSYGADHKKFEGTFANDQLDIQRIINHRNNFKPVIKGKIEEESNSTLISATLMLHEFVQAFIYTWLGLAGFFGLVALLILFYGDGSPYILLIWPALILFAFGLPRFGFWLEAKNTKEALIDLLNGGLDNGMP